VERGKKPPPTLQEELEAGAIADIAPGELPLRRVPRERNPVKIDGLAGRISFSLPFL